MAEYVAGLYRLKDSDKKYPDPKHEESKGEWHTDGYEFHYLNTAGNWCDIGWGDPFDWDMDKLELMTPKYAELKEYEDTTRDLQVRDSIVSWGDVADDIAMWREYEL